MAIEEEFTEELEALPAGHIVLRVQQALVMGEHLVVICFQKFRAQDLVLCQQFL